MTMAHDDPELRARVKAELLYPSRQEYEIQAVRRAYRKLHDRWNISITRLSRDYHVPEDVMQQIIDEEDAA